ncbi:MAG: beta-galactosidase [Bacilli bacterium]|nr:beta-galactosidase [Bacilli bacterium]
MKRWKYLTVEYPKEPMETHTKNIDGINVLFQYDKVVPSFDTYKFNEPTRKYLSLDGEWKFNFDLENRGLEGKYYAVDFDDSTWQSVMVPHCIDTMEKHYFQSFSQADYGKGPGFFDGFAWYRKHITLNNTWNNKVITLKFLGAYYSAWIFVNGEYVAVHEGGHTPFSIDITDYVHEGDNLIAVRILRDKWYDDYLAQKPQPITHRTHIVHSPVDLWPYGGLTRNVYLEGTEKVYISKILVNARDKKLEIKVIATNDTEEERHIKVSINPGEGTNGILQEHEVVIRPKSVRVISDLIDIPNAELWELDNPRLYEARATLDNGDSLSSKYGMRTFRTCDTKLLLNDKAIFLKGLNWHEETFENGRAMTKKEYDRELSLMQESGAIFLRNCVYNRHPYAYEYCDSHGLLMLDDIDHFWITCEMQKFQLEEYGLSRALALKMAWNNMNHPSVVMWCVQNECDMSKPDIFRAWVYDLVNAIRSIDIQNRPITQAQQSIRWADPSLDICDVIGVNEYLGTHHETDKEHELALRLERLHMQYPHKPILITENGAWSIKDHEETEKWHIERFNAHYEQVLSVSEFVVGYVMWVFKDYKTRHPYARKNNGVSGMGIVTFDKLEKKKIFDVYKNAKVPEYHLQKVPK